MSKSLIRKTSTGICCLVLALLFSANAAEAGESPKKAVQTFIETIRSMTFPIQDVTHHTELVKKANAYLDLKAMVKSALADDWTHASVEERQTFLDLMWKLIDRVAYAQSGRFMGQYHITYPLVEKGKAGFDVHSVIQQKSEALNADVVYHLNKTKDQWKINDIVLDDVSMIEDLHYQFDKIIRGSSFSGLLNRMRNRLAKAEKQNKGVGE